MHFDEISIYFSKKKTCDTSVATGSTSLNKIDNQCMVAWQFDHHSSSIGVAL